LDFDNVRIIPFITAGVVIAFAARGVHSPKIRKNLAARQLPVLQTSADSSNVCL
jgi:hypothetical protein